MELTSEECEHMHISISGKWKPYLLVVTIAAVIIVTGIVTSILTSIFLVTHFQLEKDVSTDSITVSVNTARGMTEVYIQRCILQVDSPKKALWYTCRCECCLLLVGALMPTKVC